MINQKRRPSFRPRHSNNKSGYRGRSNGTRPNNGGHFQNNNNGNNFSRSKSDSNIKPEGEQIKSEAPSVQKELSPNIDSLVEEQNQ